MNLLITCGFYGLLEKLLGAKCFLHLAVWTHHATLNIFIASVNFTIRIKLFLNLNSRFVFGFFENLFYFPQRFLYIKVQVVWRGAIFKLTNQIHVFWWCQRESPKRLLKSALPPRGVPSQFPRLFRSFSFPHFSTRLTPSSLMLDPTFGSQTQNVIKFLVPNKLAAPSRLFPYFQIGFRLSTGIYEIHYQLDDFHLKTNNVCHP